MRNTAKNILIPDKSKVFRTVFLYVGQGDATLLLIPEGDKYRTALIDCHNDESNGGINIVALMKDLFEGTGCCLDWFINTHPHLDHISGIKDIYDEINITQLWHSGHTPGKEYKDAYRNLEYVIKKLGKNNVFIYTGSRSDNFVGDFEIHLGDINYNILAPAEYVSDDIEGEAPDVRYNRIHEQCGVIRFKYGKNEKQILLTGDADYDAWTKHITDFHKDRLPSTVLSASHHGSNTFFWKSAPDENPFKQHMDIISPSYIIVSAPKQKESKHNHPADEAMEQYRTKVGKDNLLHLGANRECVIVDIDDEGNIEIYTDKELVDTYGSDNEDASSGAGGIFIPNFTKIDDKPMG